MAINRSVFYKELSKKDSNAKIKELLKQRINFQKKHYKPGNLMLTSYNAKHKENVFDKTPLVLILKRNSKYTLGLNFHWLPLKMRMKLIETIIRLNTQNIKKGKPLEFSYEQLKPMLRGLGYAPCIRKYINVRFGRVGIAVEPERLAEIARIRTETFTGGKYTAQQLYQKARNHRVR